MGSAALNLLLDTHVWLWTLLEPDRVGSRARQAIERDGNELWLSPISVWEAALLSERGRVAMEGGPPVWLERALVVMPLRDAPLTREVALASRRVELPHEDPADRFIAASAMVHGLVLVSADERLLGVAGYETLPAR